MQAETSRCQPNLHDSYLYQINGIEFTFREIDILACINEESNLAHFAKKISGFLQESSHKFKRGSYRTINSQLLTLRKKLKVDTTEEIKDFIQNSSIGPILKCHYTILENHFKMMELLYELSPLLSQTIQINIIYGHDDKYLKSIVDSLKYYLDLAGVISSIKFEKHLSHLSRDASHISIILLTPQDLEKIPPEENFPLSLQSDSHSLKNIYLVCTEIQEITFLSFTSNTSTAHLKKSKSFYCILVELFKHLMPSSPRAETLIKKFNDHYKPVCLPKISASFLSPQKSQVPQGIILTKLNVIKSILFKQKNCLLLGFLLILLFILSLHFMIEKSPLSRNEFLSPKKMERKDNPLSDTMTTQQEFQPVYSELELPHESILLKRPELIEQLRAQTQNKKGITTIGIVGMGGAGKTTLARLWGHEWAHSHPKASVWELNAETPSSLRNSFKDLSRALAQTFHQKETLSAIDHIQNRAEKEKQRLEFIKGCLKENPDWMLIYDNVTTWSSISPYFPQNPQVWGHGHVILTTRNTHIKKADPLSPNTIIELTELSPHEALTLFTRMRFNQDPSKLFPREREEANQLLKHIPLFPLDISIAGRYMEIFNLNSDTYLTQLNTHSEEFNHAQEQLLKEVCSYTKPRYMIITLSLKKLIEVDENFKKLLLFVGLMDSQNIPKEILERLCSTSVAHQFLYELQKLSLITNEPVKNKLDTFSIHRITQDIIRAYSINTFNLQEKKEALKPVFSILEDYLDTVIEKEDLSRMVLMLNHCEKILSYENLLTPDIINSIKGELGSIYFYIGHYEEAIALLHPSIDYLNTHNQHPLKLGLRLSCLGYAYLSLGDSEKGIDYNRQSVSFFKKYFSTNYLKIATHLTYLGNAYINIQNEAETAKNILEQAHFIFKDHALENHIWFARNLIDFGKAYRNLGDYKNAKPLLEKGVNCYTRQRVPNPYRTAWASVHLAKVYTDIGHYQEAKKLLEDALKVYKEGYANTPNTAEIAWILIALARAHSGLGQYEEAQKLLDESFSLYTKNLPKNHIDRGSILLDLGEVSLHLKNYEKAKKYFEESLKVYQNNNHVPYKKMAHLLNSIGIFYMLSNEHDKAQHYMTKALKTYQQHPSLHWSLESLADLCKRKAQEAQKKKKSQEAAELRKKAEQYLLQALEIVKNIYPKESIHIKRSKSKLHNCKQSADENTY